MAKRMHNLYTVEELNAMNDDELVTAYAHIKAVIQELEANLDFAETEFKARYSAGQEHATSRFKLLHIKEKDGLSFDTDKAKAMNPEWKTNCSKPRAGRDFLRLIPKNTK